MTKPNPYIDQPNYFEGYTKSIEGLKNHPEFVEFDKLCYEVLELNESGKKLLELLRERYILPALVNISNPNYQVACIWGEGIKEAFRILTNAVKNHANRLKMETNQ